MSRHVKCKNKQRHTYYVQNDCPCQAALRLQRAAVVVVAVCKQGKLVGLSHRLTADTSRMWASASPHCHGCGTRTETSPHVSQRQHSYCQSTKWHKRTTYTVFQMFDVWQ